MAQVADTAPPVPDTVEGAAGTAGGSEFPVEHDWVAQEEAVLMSAAAEKDVESASTAVNPMTAPRTDPMDEGEGMGMDEISLDGSSGVTPPEAGVAPAGETMDRETEATAAAPVAELRAGRLSIFDPETNPDSSPFGDVAQHFMEWDCASTRSRGGRPILSESREREF